MPYLKVIITLAAVTVGVLFQIAFAHHMKVEGCIEASLQTLVQLYGPPPEGSLTSVINQVTLYCEQEFK